MSDDATTYQKLARRFDAGDHKTRKQGGRDLTYLPGEKVIGRLNEVLGFAWSFRVADQGATEAEAWVLGELTATIEGATVTRQQYGNQDLARGQHATTDLFKSAATDALKKCATTIGVGLYLYDEDERREVEQEMREAKRPKAPAPTTPARPTAPTSGAPAPVTPEVDAAAKLTGADPRPLKTKPQLEDDVRRGVAAARALDLDVADIDTAPLNRAQLLECIEGLADMVREARSQQAQAS